VSADENFHHVSLFLLAIGCNMRRGGLENIVTTGKIEGRRDRGRQCEKMLDSLIAWHGLRSTEDMFRCMANRRLEKHDRPLHQAWP
jgi:hypothetical protein